LFPTVDLVDVDRVLYHADAGVVAAERALRACVRVAAEHGVRVEERVRVERVAPDGDGVVVEAAGRAVSADCAIVSAGAWSPRLLAGTGVALDVTPSSTHVAYYSGRQDGEVPALIEHFVDDPTSYSYVVPSLDGSGVKVGRYWKEQEPVDPDTRTLEVDDRVIAVHSEYVARRLPTLDPVPVHSESCLYEMTASEDFVVDRAGPIVVGAGFSGHGFKFMPLVGRLLADAALGTLSEPLPAELSLAAHASTRAGRPAR
jgi:sarcosine oxidase